jgi:hypothetical protein
LAGDVLKTLYFVYADAPQQFLLTAALQLVLDAVLFFQVCFYSSDWFLSFGFALILIPCTCVASPPHALSVHDV